MSDYRCSVCGAEAYYDGRCGDGPVLTCGCDQGPWVDEGSRGGYHSNPRGATPVKSGDYHNPNNPWYDWAPRC